MKTSHNISFKLVLTYLFISISSFIQAQNANIGIGTTSPDADAILDIESNDKGLLIPRLTDGQQLGLTGPDGLLLFNTTQGNLQYRYSNSWRPVGLWRLSASGEKAYYNAGNVGIGTDDPLTLLSIAPAAFGAKITLWDSGVNTTAHYGFGISSQQLNYDVSASSASHVFYAGGKNGTGTELMRIKGNGNVGIGGVDPSDMLVINDGGRVEMLDDTDATGTAGSGVLEIDNSLRIDGNEIITNTNTTLHLQADNGGDLDVDDETLYVDASANRVGINENVPNVPLHVQGGADAALTTGGYLQTGSTTSTNIIMDDNEIIARNNGGTSALYLNQNGGNIHIGIGSASTSSTGATVYMGRGGSAGTADYTLVVGHDDGDYGIYIKNNSFTSSYWGLYQKNEVGASTQQHEALILKNSNGDKGRFRYSSGGYSTVSDSRLKENVREMEAVLPSLLQLQAKRYTFITDPSKEENIGFIAQDVEKFFPEFVTPPSVSANGEESPYMVYYAGYGIIAVKAIQEQQAIIEAQAEQIEAQQAEIDAIKRALQKAGIELE